MINMHLG